MGNNSCACDCAGGTRTENHEEIRDMKILVGGIPQKTSGVNNGGELNSAIAKQAT